MPDPWDALRLPPQPVAPDPAFAAALRARMIDALLAPTTKEPVVNSSATTRDATPPAPRNGLQHGDISYLTFGVDDAVRARAFYGPLFGWAFEPGDPSPRSQVRGVRPEMGLHADGTRAGVVLAYRVDDIAVAVERQYAWEADCVDPHGIPFYLHQFEDGPTQTADLANGAHHGDVAYITLGVPDLASAQAFYGAVLGWTFSAGRSGQGGQTNSVTPMTGIWGGGDWTGARLAYRVDDIAAAVEQVAALGGTTGPVERRPYGLACDDCVDDQGSPFMLLQLAD